MKIPQIRIESQSALIAINQTDPVQEIEQPMAKVSIEQPAATVKIETTPGKLTIDQTKAWEDMDLKSIFKRTKEFANQGFKDCMEGIARRTQQGNELMRIENKGNPISNQANENSQPPMKQFSIGWIPSHFSVDIDYIPAQVKITSKSNKPIIKIDAEQPIITYQRGEISINLKQKNELNIDFINL